MPELPYVGETSPATCPMRRHKVPLYLRNHWTRTLRKSLTLNRAASPTPVKVPSSSFSIRWSVFSEKNHHRGWRLPAPPAPNLDEDLGFLRVFGPLQGGPPHPNPPDTDGHHAQHGRLVGRGERASRRAGLFAAGQVVKRLQIEQPQETIGRVIVRSAPLGSGRSIRNRPRRTR